MAKRELSITLRAKNALRKGLNKAKKSLRSLKKTVGRIGRGIGKVFKVGSKAAFAFGAAVTAVATKAVTAYAKQEKAANSLHSALKEQGDAADELMPKFKELASAIQDETAAADENTLQMMAQIRNLGVMPKDMEKATKGTLGLAKALDLNNRQAARYTALAMQGETTILQRYVPALREATSEAEKQKIVSDLMSKGYKQLQAELDTTSGRWKELKGRVGDAWEQLGKAITESSALKGMLANLSEKVLGLTKRFKDWVRNGGMIQAINTAKVFGVEFVASLKKIGSRAKDFYNLIDKTLIQPVRNYADLIMNVVVPAGKSFAALLKGDFREAGRLAKEAIGNDIDAIKKILDPETYKQYSKDVKAAWKDMGEGVEKIEKEKNKKIREMNKKFRKQRLEREVEAEKRKNAKIGSLIEKALDKAVGVEKIKNQKIKALREEALKLAIKKKKEGNKNIEELREEDLQNAVTTGMVKNQKLEKLLEEARKIATAAEKEKTKQRKKALKKEIEDEKEKNAKLGMLAKKAFEKAVETEKIEDKKLKKLRDKALKLAIKDRKTSNKDIEKLREKDLENALEGGENKNKKLKKLLEKLRKMTVEAEKKKNEELEKEREKAHDKHIEAQKAVTERIRAITEGESWLSNLTVSKAKQWKRALNVLSTVKPIPDLNLEQFGAEGSDWIQNLTSGKARQIARAFNALQGPMGMKPLPDLNLKQFEAIAKLDAGKIKGAMQALNNAQAQKIKPFKQLANIDKNIEKIHKQNKKLLTFS